MEGNLESYVWSIQRNIEFQQVIGIPITTARGTVQEAMPGIAISI
jgi:hypothetical protein